MTENPRIRTLFLEGPAGRLEALLNEGSNSPTHAAVVAHPHPLFGGTMHNKVVFHAMKALNNFGFPVLRFNFRGTGLSEGKHDQGRGEVQDVVSAIDWLDREYHLPVVFAGFSFGAATGLQASCSDPRVEAVVGLGLPVRARDYTYDFLQSCSKPKLFVSGSQDEFAPPAEIRKLIDGVPEPKQLTIIEDGDHFFAGKLDEMRETIEQWLKSQLGL